MSKVIESLDELKTLAFEQYHECYILLNGFLRSSKRVWYSNIGEVNQWHIINEIDDTEEEYVDDEDLKKRYALFIEAIEKRCLISY